MVSAPVSVEEQMAQLRASFALRLPGRVDEIASAWRAIAQNAWNAENAKRFHRLTHSLAGAAATFGFAALSQVARQLELYVEPFVPAQMPLTPEQRATIEQKLAALASPQLQSPTAVVENSARTAGRPAGDHANRRLLLLTQGSAMDRLIAQIGFFDYQVQLVNTWEELTQEYHRALPAAILVDADLYATRGKLDAYRVAPGDSAPRPPVIFFSAHGDLSARLTSVRAGADAYFTKPVNLSRLVDKLDLLSSHQAPDPYRILVVEDDEDLAEFYAMTLRQAGMEINCVSDPNLVLQQLMDWKPDLILMDLYMPHCSGLELATVIRQQEAYVSIPIVYLSAETRIEKQLAAMSQGGDDFLTKPIQPEHLISSVTARAQRSHALRSLILRDSLTGLLNHTAIKGQLESEIVRATRNHSALSYVMLDIDNFKRVNDTYGHPTGDSVLKTLARLLQQRLRKTDIIGRYGGEEFAIILPEATAPQAQEILNEVRSRFSYIRQQSSKEDFQVTLSAGVAAFPAFADAKSLSGAADQALYQAKHRGRNQIALA